MNLKELFAQIPIEPNQEFGSLTLDSYFSRDPQLYDALPERPRGIIDLAEYAKTELRNKARKPYAPASRVVEHIWRRASETSREPLENYRNIVRVHETTGALDVRDSLITPGIDFHTLLAAQSRPLDGRPVVSFLKLDRLDAYFLDTHSKAPKLLPRSATAALMLASDIAFDQNRGTWNGVSTEINGYDGKFANSEYQPPETSSLIYFAWPLPAGYSLPFYAALSYRWKAALFTATSSHEGAPQNPLVDADEMARHFLHAVVSLLWAKATGKRENLSLAWAHLAERVIDLLHQGGTRTRNWALRRAGLLAAPEYGLSADAANTWLQALYDAAGQERWKTLRDAMSAERRERMLDLKVSERSKTQIDESFLQHQWTFLIEGNPDVVIWNMLTSDETPPNQEQIEPVETLGPNAIQALKKAMSDAELPTNSYFSERFSDLRPEVLTALKESLHGREGLANGQARALKALWDMAVRLEGQPDLEELMTPSGPKIVFSEDGVLRFSAHLLHNLHEPSLLCSAVRVEALDNPTIMVRGKTLSTLLALLYEYAWDFATENLDGTGLVSPLTGMWPGVEVMVTHSLGTTSVPWPTFRWPMFSTIFQVIAAWNKKAAQVMRLPDKDLTSQNKVDILALWLLRTSMFGGDLKLDKHELALSLDFSAENYSTMATGVHSANLEKKSREQWRRAGAAWNREMVLFATPESGLSVAAAGAIINSYPYKRAFKTELEALRVRQIRATGVDENDAARIIAEIDKNAMASQHPWYTMLGESPDEL